MAGRFWRSFGGGWWDGWETGEAGVCWESVAEETGIYIRSDPDAVSFWISSRRRIPVDSSLVLFSTKFQLNFFPFVLLR